MYNIEAFEICRCYLIMVWISWIERIISGNILNKIAESRALKKV